MKRVFIGKALARMGVVCALAASAPLAQAIVSTDNPNGWVLEPGSSFGGALDGAARLVFTNAGGNFLCSGSLLRGGEYVLTAAHCADDFTAMTLSFQEGAVTRTASQAWVDSRWVPGTFGSGADIALVKLNEAVTGIQGFDLAPGNVLGSQLLMVGYGLVGNGNTGGTGLDANHAHYGYNVFDVALPGAAGLTYGYDFDNGTRNQDTYCWTYGVCGAGLDSFEALFDSGDSGGGSFVWDGAQWLLAGVHSFGQSFGRFSCPFDRAQLCGDIDAVRLNSTFGEAAGDTAVVSHLDWINAFLGAPGSAVPEPGGWALMLAALGGMSVCRRRAGP